MNKQWEHFLLWQSELRRIGNEINKLIKYLSNLIWYIFPICHNAKMWGTAILVAMCHKQNFERLLYIVSGGQVNNRYIFHCMKNFSKSEVCA